MIKKERYNIIHQLGTGGCGTVFKAFDTVLQRNVALKQLKKSENNEDTRQLLLDEAKILAAIEHPNIISIYDVYSTEDVDEIVMEYIKGVTLADLVKRHLLLESDFKTVAMQVLEALHTAHSAGVLHRDIKPENIMLHLNSENHYEVKICDFGMSSLMGSHVLEETTSLTGSIHMMAPEIFEGKASTPQSDLYALGCIFYYILTGAHPFEGDTAVQIMAMHVSGKYPPLHTLRPDIHPDICTWIDSLVSSAASNRPNTCEEALMQLANIEVNPTQRKFSLPTALTIESTNSRIVRPINLRSINENTDETTKVILANTAAHAIQMGKHTSAHQLPPQGAEWFFNVKGAIKGPIELPQLQVLCSEGKVNKNTLIWHPHFGEWIKASNCTETKDHIVQTRRGSSRVTSRQDSRPILETSASLRGLITERKKIYLNIETITIALGTVCTAAVIAKWPDHNTTAITALAALFLAVGLVRSRLHQAKSGKNWLLFCTVCPLIGDIAHSLARPSTRSILGMLMLLTGAGYLTFLALGKMETHQEGSLSEAPTEEQHQSTPLILSQIPDE